MKKFIFTLFLTAAIGLQANAQNPTDDGPGDPGGNVYTYENGYAEGAIEAANLLQSIAATYNGSFQSLEWHLFDANFAGNFGTVTDCYSEGLKLPKIVWSVAPSNLIRQDQSGINRANELELSRYNDDYSLGYYQGFIDQWYATYY